MKIEDAVSTGSSSTCVETLIPIPTIIPSLYLSQSTPDTFPLAAKTSFGHFVRKLVDSVFILRVFATAVPAINGIQPHASERFGSI